MKKNLVLIIPFLLCLLGTGGCEDNGKFSNPELVRAWKFVGFGTTENDQIQAAQPENCDKCYVLTFLEDGTFNGQTSTNQVTGKYVISSQNKELKILNLDGTKINELFDGKRYVESIVKVESFSITENGLTLYYNEKKQFLLFKPILL